MLTSLKPDIAARQLVFQLNIPVTHFARAFFKCFLQSRFANNACGYFLWSRLTDYPLSSSGKVLLGASYSAF
jgi:hypothetical protein